MHVVICARSFDLADKKFENSLELDEMQNFSIR
jgi:hypothetical protein